MKKFIFLTAVLFSSLGLAKDVPQFSAFAKGDELYVTIIGDECNKFRGSLKPADNCAADRVMMNRAIQCSAELTYIKSFRACSDPKEHPRVMTISLKDANIAPEAQSLELTLDGQTIEVLLNQNP